MAKTYTKSFGYRPFGRQWEIIAEQDRPIAIVPQEADAKLLAGCANYFQRLYGMLRHAKGEFENHTTPNTTAPAYSDLLELQAEVEADVRNWDF